MSAGTSRAGPAGDADEPDWMQQHTSMRAAADALAAEAARKARIAAAQARAKAAQLRRAKRKVRVASLVEAPCPRLAGHLLVQGWQRVYSTAGSRSEHCQDLKPAHSTGLRMAAANPAQGLTLGASHTLQEAAAIPEEPTAGGGDEDADFVLDEWDSDGGQPGNKRSNAALRCRFANSITELCQPICRAPRGVL
jgi:hypothetical protein